jgi:hypothetical protein
MLLCFFFWGWALKATYSTYHQGYVVVVVVGMGFKGNSLPILRIYATPAVLE